MAVNSRRVLCGIYCSKIRKLRTISKESDLIAEEMLVKKVAASGILKENSIARLFEFPQPHIENPIQTFQIFPRFLVNEQQFSFSQPNNVLSRCEVSYQTN